jgi:N-acetylmuramoyl-L-alanine amidase
MALIDRMRGIGDDAFFALPTATAAVSHLSTARCLHARCLHARRLQLWPLACALLLSSGCSTLVDRGSYYADPSHSALGQNDRVRYLILHYTALNDEQSLRVLTQRRVSSHYLVPTHPRKVDDKPVALALVSEPRRAWHAGKSFWAGVTDLNNASIGIEIVNPGYSEASGEKRFYPYPPAQIELVTRLAQDIVSRYGIAPVRVLGHSDIAPQRKEDPGPLFPWRALAQAGVGAWPNAATVAHFMAGRDPQAPVNVADVQRKLARYGYEIDRTGRLDRQTINVVRAFQMHFRPTSYSGVPDAHTEAILDALIARYIDRNEPATVRPSGMDDPL